MATRLMPMEAPFCSKIAPFTGLAIVLPVSIYDLLPEIFCAPADCAHNDLDQTPMMYSSTDLLSWKNLGAQASSVTGLWRPKLATPSGAGSFWASTYSTATLAHSTLERSADADAGRLQIYGQQDRRILSLQPSHLVGGYKTSAKVLLPPSNASYSDTGIFCDEGTGMDRLALARGGQLN